MAVQKVAISKLSFKPVSAEVWPDLEALFGERGACGGCWCMYWRISRKEFNAQKGDGNKKAFKKIVKDGAVPGIIAYADGKPVGWCAVRPREDYPVLDGSRILKPVDEQPVWSIVCQFVLAPYRRQGVSAKLLEAVVKHVKKQGGKIVEGYPHDPKTDQPAAFVWTGLAPAFLEAGFEEVARRSATRPIMRYVIQAERRK
ncbi:MAG TPA: GNAT family N-acetyltransferase [bacterium]|jgi:GNAT superfamily N-acetyltransferase